MQKKDELAYPESYLNKAKDNEMIFVLLARDDSAGDAVRAWIESRVRRGKNQRTDKQIVIAEMWIDEHRKMRE